MKYLLALLIILSSNQLLAEDNEWSLHKLSIYSENDVFFGTDKSYSSGVRANIDYKINNQDYPLFTLLGKNDTKSDSYVSFALTNQIFTPSNTEIPTLIINDRPYAGWSFVETAMHKATKDELRSLTLKVGFVGPASYGEQVQTQFHKYAGFEPVNGWQNQINSELGINLKYVQKWKNSLDIDMQNIVVPFVSAELGNIATNVKAGVMTRFGWNIQKDYGISSIDLGAESGIPQYASSSSVKTTWGFSFNFSAAASFIARDIFLDGNTFSNSHSVNKKPLVGYLAYGFTLRYENFLIDYMNIHNSKQFTLESKPHLINGITLSYLF